MHIDARAIDVKELMLRLKELLASQIGCEVDIEIVFDLEADVEKVKSFVRMSGCKADINKTDESCILHITGGPCCV